MILFLDFETTTIWNEDNPRGNPSPHLPENYLVSAGWYCDETSYQYRFIHHDELTTLHTNLPYLNELVFAEFQDLLNRTTLLVAHNVKFELSWLRAVGLTYNGKVADTMLREYILSKGQKMGYGLKDSCERNGVTLKKSELIDDYMKVKIGFNSIPMEIVEEYGRGDIKSCKELYENQLERLAASPHLWPTINLTEQFSRCLTDIEKNGIKIDLKELDRLETEYQLELQILTAQLNETVKEVMGTASNVNLNSPEQLSQVLYSRRVINKKRWKEVFNLGSEKRGSVNKPKRRRKMSTYDFVMHIKELTEPVYVKEDIEDATVAMVCNTSNSNVVQSGANEQPLREAAKKPSKVSKVAGFRFVPSSAFDVAVGGFRTDGATLDRLIEMSEGRARTFLTSLKRANQIETYLSTFIAGIRRSLRANNVLHTSFMQHVTATGRLSSREPNFHNMPRGQTFPVRKAVISRWPGGKILEGDFKQLEFRAAGELSGDKQILEDVLSGLDVHSKTAEYTKLSRQDSKAYTFRPLYGGSEHGKPEHEATYIRYFKKRYWELFAAHERWGTDVLTNGSYISPSGREFIYPGTVRFVSGGFSNRTVVSNYPVQSWATADLVPIAVIKTWKLLKQHNLKSVIFLTVHDSIEIDCHPDEINICIDILQQGMNCLAEECVKRYNYTLTVPIEGEYKIGDNWLELDAI